MSNKVEHYTYGEFVHNARTRDNISGDNSSRTGDFSFTQTKNFEQAIEYATVGWDLGLEEYKIEDGVLANGTTHLNPSVSGCIPHVQNFIQGFPEQMLDLYDEREYNLPTLDLVVNLNYAWHVESEDTLKFGKSIVSYINAMASTHNIRLTGVFALKWRKINETKVQAIKLKNFDESLVLNNIAFAFHPSFFRRIWFSVMEGKKYFSSGYGQNNANYKKHIEGLLDGVESSKTMYFKSLMSIEKFDFTPEEVEDYIH